MVAAAIISTLAYLAFRFGGSKALDYEAEIEARTGVELPSRRIRVRMNGAMLWIFGGLAIVLWTGALLQWLL